MRLSTREPTVADPADAQQLTASASGRQQRMLPLSDVVLAAALTAFAQLDLWLNIENADQYGPQWAVAICAAIATSVLAVRRVAPLTTVAVVALAMAAPELVTLLTITLWGHFVPTLVATYSVARYAERRRATAGLLISSVAFVVVLVQVPSVGSVANIPFSFVPLVVVWLIGRGLRRRDRSHAALSLQASQLAEDQEAWARDAVAAERARIARELHDIVAHSVSVMVIQAGAAEDLLDRDPQSARQPLRAVQETGQETVAELGRMLGLLRTEAPKETLAPQYGLTQLPELIAHVRDAGIDVAYDVLGTPIDLPPGVELALYRVAQEALTNVLKHARGTRATVVLSYSDAAVELGVRDNGRGGGSGPTPGHGLIGMRERVVLYGGTLAAGPHEGGGFAVDATIPLTSGIGTLRR